MLILLKHIPIGSKIRETNNNNCSNIAVVYYFFRKLYVVCKRAGVWAAPALLAFLCKQYIYLYCRCDDTQPPPLRSPAGWASWLQPQSRDNPGGMYTTFSLPPYRHTQVKKINLRSYNAVAYFPVGQVFLGGGDAHLLMPLTSSDAHGWCMLRHQPPSDISCSSLSCSRKLARSSLPLSSAELLPFSVRLEFSLPLTSTHWKVQEQAQDGDAEGTTKT